MTEISDTPAPAPPQQPLERMVSPIPNAWRTLKLSTQKVPQLRWVYGVIGVAAAAAIVRGLGVAPEDVLVVVAPFVLAMLLFFVFSKVASGPLGALLSWAVVLLMVACMVGLVCSVFFDYPKPITLLADQLRKAFETQAQPRKETTTEKWRSPDSLEAGASSTPSTETPKARASTPSGSEPSRSYVVSGETLFERLPDRFRVSPGASPLQTAEAAGELVIDGGILALPTSATAMSRSLVVDRLVLRNAGRIVTNGSGLDVTARSVVSDGGAVVAFDAIAAPVPAGIGAGGVDGRSAKDVRLTVFHGIAGRLRVNLDGEPGGPGGAGRPGSAGSHGPNGAHASTSLIECKRGAGDGGPGGPGSDGAGGAPGGRGGDAGRLLVYGSPELSKSIEYSGKGGTGGAGGRGGEGGAGGQGGRGGDARPPYCMGSGRNGPPGISGRPGGAGQNGSPGTAGSFERQAQ